MRVFAIILLILAIGLPSGFLKASPVAPELSASCPDETSPACPPALVPIYNPFVYVHTKDMLLLMVVLSLGTLAVSASTDDEGIIGITYLALGLTGLILIPAVIIYDWIVLLGG